AVEGEADHQGHQRVHRSVHHADTGARTRYVQSADAEPTTKLEKDQERHEHPEGRDYRECGRRNVHVTCPRLLGCVAAASRYGGRSSIRGDAELRELELEARLEELRRGMPAESIEAADAVGELEPGLVVEMPVHHRRDAPELSTAQAVRGQIDVRDAEHGLEGSRAALEHRAPGRDGPEGSGRRDVGTRLARDDPGD